MSGSIADLPCYNFLADRTLTDLSAMTMLKTLELLVIN